MGQLYYTERSSTPKKTEFKGWIRWGLDHSRFTSQSVTSRVGGDAEESLRRLDELLAEVEAIVERSGSDKAEELLQEAVYFRNQAEAELRVILQAERARADRQPGLNDFVRGLNREFEARRGDAT